MKLSYFVCLKVNAFGRDGRNVGDDKPRRNKYSTSLVSNIYEILIKHLKIRTLPMTNSSRHDDSAASECADLSPGSRGNTIVKLDALNVMHLPNGHNN